LNHPLVIAGPCSAETEEQVLKIAHELKDSDVSIFRAGIWKPRTRPGGFEGVGEIGLKWLQKELVNQKEAYFSQGQENSLEFQSGYEQTWDENSYMKVFSNQNDVLTISYENDGFSGGAHGYYNILFKNFDLKTNAVIQLSDVFMDVNKIDWNKILMRNFKNPDQKEMLLVDKIPVNNNFYFDSQNITFVYNQYEITAYAAGVVEISIPFPELKPYLKPEFISRNNIK
jgi:hypothetical protein